MRVSTHRLTVPWVWTESGSRWVPQSSVSVTGVNTAGHVLLVSRNGSEGRGGAT